MSCKARLNILIASGRNVLLFWEPLFRIQPLSINALTSRPVYGVGSFLFTREFDLDLIERKDQSAFRSNSSTFPGVGSSPRFSSSRSYHTLRSASLVTSSGTSNGLFVGMSKLYRVLLKFVGRHSTNQVNMPEDRLSICVKSCSTRTGMVPILK